MLVLSRRQHQRIRLGDSIVVTVVRVSGDKVRLGIEAPKDMLVLREELQPYHRGEEGPDEGATAGGSRSASEPNVLESQDAGERLVDLKAAS